MSYAIFNADSFKSSSVGSGLIKVIARFILLASSCQLDMPIVGIFIASWFTENYFIIFASGFCNERGVFCGSSNSWRTFSGLCGDISANPISSMITKTCISYWFSLHLLKYYCLASAFSNTFLIPAEVDYSDPWYMRVKIDGNFLNRSFLEQVPLKDLVTKFIAKDLELPGFPTMNKGILLMMQTIIAKIFSFKRLLRPMPYGISIPLIYFICSSSRTVLKYLQSNPKHEIKGSSYFKKSSLF